MNKVEEVTTDILNSFAGILLFVVSLAAFYLPYEIRIIPAVLRVLPFVRYACAGLLLAAFLTLYISTLRVFRDNWALWAAAGFVLVLVFSTRMNGGDMESALGTHGLAGFFLVMDLAVFFKVNPKRYLLLAFFLLLLANIANTWTVFEYCLRRGTGMWEAYGEYRNSFYSLFGNYNGGIEYVLPMAICGSCYAHRYGKWLEPLNYAAMLMSLYMAVRCESLTQVIAFAAILAFMVLGDIALISEGFARILKIVFQPVILAGIDLAAFIVIVVLNRTNWVQRLGMDPDFHNRRHVWNMAMDWIKASPVWGNGQETVGVEASKITGYAHSHSTYLEVGYKTGFVGAVFLVLMLAAAVAAIYLNRHARVSYILSCMLFVCGLAAVSETYPMVYVMLCLGLVYYIAKNTNETGAAARRVKQVPDEPRDKDPAADSAAVSYEPDRFPKARKRTASQAPKPQGQPQVSAYEIQEDVLEQVGQRVQEVQSAAEEEIRENMDHTVHIDETVLYQADQAEKQEKP